MATVRFELDDEESRELLAGKQIVLSIPFEKVEVVSGMVLKVVAATAVPLQSDEKNPRKLSVTVRTI